MANRHPKLVFRHFLLLDCTKYLALYRILYTKISFIQKLYTQISFVSVHLQAFLVASLNNKPALFLNKYLTPMPLFWDFSTAKSKAANKIKKMTHHYQLDPTKPKHNPKNTLW